MYKLILGHFHFHRKILYDRQIGGQRFPNGCHDVKHKMSITHKSYFLKNGQIMTKQYAHEHISVWLG